MITTVHAAKTRLSELLRRVEAGEEVIIARDDTPVARIVPVFPETAGRTFGAMRGRARLDAAFFEPLPDDLLRAWE
jgi:prevent-host-death family protein